MGNLQRIKYKNQVKTLMNIKPGKNSTTRSLCEKEPSRACVTGQQEANFNATEL